MSHQEVQPLASEAVAGKTVLVVEDDSGIGNFLVQAIVQETPYRATLAVDGFQALEAVATINSRA